jgi:hypothetical protein
LTVHLLIKFLHAPVILAGFIQLAAVRPNSIYFLTNLFSINIHNNIHMENRMDQEDDNPNPVFKRIDEILKCATDVAEIDQALMDLIDQYDTDAGQHNHLPNSSKADNPACGIRR